MAELFALAGGQRWRKYTVGQELSNTSLQMLFFVAARRELGGDSIERVLARMRRIGAVVGSLGPGPTQESREG